MSLAGPGNITPCMLHFGDEFVLTRPPLLDTGLLFRCFLSIIVFAAETHFIVTQQCLYGLLRVGVPHAHTGVQACGNQVLEVVHYRHPHDDVRVSLES